MQKKHIAIFAAAALLNVEVISAEEIVNHKKSVAPTSTIKQSNENNSTQKDQVLAVVNGKKIMKSYFDKGFQDAPLENQKRLLKRVIASELFVEYASIQPLFSDKELIKRVTEKSKKLKSEGKQSTDLDQRMVLGLLVVNTLAKEDALKQITDEKVTNYYLERKKNFTHMKYVEAYSIKVSSKDEAQKIIDTLNKDNNKDKKATFIKLAQTYNIKNENKSGDLGRIYKFGTKNNPFNSALFSLEEGKYSLTPIKTNDSYQIIYCDKKDQTKNTPSQKELDSNIRVILIHKLATEWLNNKLTELKQNAEIINYLK